MQGFCQECVNASGAYTPCINLNGHCHKNLQLFLGAKAQIIALPACLQAAV
jgi:hypothetical protein